MKTKNLKTVIGGGVDDRTKGYTIATSLGGHSDVSSYDDSSNYLGTKVK